MKGVRYNVLRGVRILDLGIITAGASTTAILADLGADVIKIEGPRYIDPFRIWNGKAASRDWWNRSPSFMATNRNKRGICLDLKSRRGREIFLQMVRESDVVVENFRVGAMERLDLDYPTLCKENPRIILASISSQGTSGPQATNVSFGSTLEASSGFASRMRHPETDIPQITGRALNYPDQVASLFAAGAIMSGLIERSRTNQGIHIDVSQRELTAFMIGEALLHELNSGKGTHPAEGNEEHFEGVFKSLDSRWVAVTLRGKESVLSTSMLGAKPSHKALKEWLCRQPATEAVKLLRAAGAAAEIVIRRGSPEGVDEICVERAFASDSNGNKVKGLPFRLGERDLGIPTPAPTLGEHNWEVLAEFGVSKSEYESLGNEDIVSDAPFGAS